MIGIKEISIAAENWAEGEWDFKDDNTNVVVTTSKNERY